MRLQVTKEGVQVPSYEELIALPTEELQRLASDPRMRRSIQRVLRRRVKCQHNKLTHRQSKCSQPKQGPIPGTLAGGKRFWNRGECH